MQLKPFLTQTCQSALNKRDPVSTTDTIALVTLTLLFAAFAATMACAEAFVRRHVAVETSNQYKQRQRRPF